MAVSRVDKRLSRRIKAARIATTPPITSKSKWFMDQAPGMFLVTAWTMELTLSAVPIFTL